MNDEFIKQHQPFTFNLSLNYQIENTSKKAIYTEGSIKLKIEN